MQQQLEGLNAHHALLCRNRTERLVPVAEHITGPGLMAEGLEINERIGGKGVHVIPAKYMYPFHWLMTAPKSGGSEGGAHLNCLHKPALKENTPLP